MENVKLGFSALGRYLIVVIMSFFITMSFSAIFIMSAPLEVTGQQVAVFETEDSEEPIDEYVHYNKDGIDTKTNIYKAKGYKIVSRDLTAGLSGTPYVAAHTLSQIFSLIFFVVIIPAKLYKLGASDTNRVYTGHMAEDKLRGLKIGIITAVCQFASWICLILGKTGVFTGGVAVYTYFNYPFFGYSQLIFGYAGSPAAIAWFSIALALLPVLLTLFGCWLAYLLGYKQIDLKSKLLYKNSGK